MIVQATTYLKVLGKKRKGKLKYYQNHYIFGQSNIFCTFRKRGNVSVNGKIIQTTSLPSTTTVAIKNSFRQCDRDCHPVL